MNPNTPRCVVIGSGSHARVVLDAALLLDIGVEGLLDTRPARWGMQVMGVKIIGDDSLLPDLAAKGVSHFIMGVGAVGDNRARRGIYELACGTGLDPLSVVHPSAVRASGVAIGAGTFVAAGAVLGVGTSIGEDVIVNTGAVVDHDCIISDHAHVAPSACLSGSVRVGEMAHVGAGAIVIQGRNVGPGAVVGAGAVVINDIDDWTTVAGVPARPIRGRSVDATRHSST